MVCTETSSTLGKIEGNSGGFLVDEDYEYLAPKFFDFTNKETRDDFRKAELWFENDNAYDPTPFLIKITGSRFYKTDCDLENLGTNEDIDIMRSYAKKVKNAFHEAVDSDDEMDLESCPVQPQCHYDVLAFKRVPGILGNKVSTPKPPLSRYRTDKGEIAHAISSGNHILKQNNTKRYYSSSMHRKHLTPYISSSKNGRATPDISQENQPIKKQKIDDGGIQPIHNGNTRVLYHKLKSNMTPLSIGKNHKKDNIVTKQNKHKLTLTRPVEPVFETKNRVRAVKIKSSAEIEEEMLAKIPKFKARPVNKKILEAPVCLGPLSRSTPHIPQFKEFHFKTMERANRHGSASTSLSSSSPSITPIDPSCDDHHSNILKLTQPKQPFLFTSLRAREVELKSTEELELEELAKVPKFKAKALNKKMFKSKGDASSLFNPKQHTTISKEFHFATNDRLGPSMVVEGSFKQLSIHSECKAKNIIPRITMLNPFNLHTKERGLKKETRIQEQIRTKQIEEEKLRIPKANPYPFTTDHPMIPPKPVPKNTTKPNEFKLESLTRHKEYMQKKTCKEGSL